MVKIQLKNGSFVFCDDLPVDLFTTDIHLYLHNTKENETYFYGCSGVYILKTKNGTWIKATDEELKMIHELNPLDPMYIFPTKIILE